MRMLFNYRPTVVLITEEIWEAFSVPFVFLVRASRNARSRSSALKWSSTPSFDKRCPSILTLCHLACFLPSFLFLLFFFVVLVDRDSLQNNFTSRDVSIGSVNVWMKYRFLKSLQKYDRYALSTCKELKWTNLCLTGKSIKYRSIIATVCTIEIYTPAQKSQDAS